MVKKGRNLVYIIIEWPLMVFDIYPFFNRGNGANEKRYRTEMLVCYIAPLMVTIMTGFTEAVAPRCSFITPRFGEEICFFSSKKIEIE